MVVDCGGGTVDITVHEVKSDGTLDEAVKGTGGAYGSTCIDDAFRNYLAEEVFSPEILGKFADEDAVNFLELFIDDWERTKCMYDPSNEEEIIYFPTRRILGFIEKRYPEYIKKLSELQEGDYHSLHLTTKQVNQLFAYSLDGLVKIIEEQFGLLGSKSCNYMYLVGGFSTSPILRQRIHTEFAKRVDKIVTPPAPGLAIVSGAVAFGLNPEIISSRKTRLTYGVKVSVPFIKGEHNESKKYWHQYGQEYRCSDIFETFVYAGQSVNVNESVSKYIFVGDPKQTSMSIALYKTKKSEVKYTDEDGVIEAGTINIDMPDTVGGLDRKVKLTLYFGKTEIKVEAIDETSGKKASTNISFSSTYGIT